MRHMRIASSRWQGRIGAGLALAVLMALSACSGAGSAQTSHSSRAKHTNLVVGARAALYVLPAAGGTTRPLLSRNTAAWLRNVSGPTWSPDGRWIAFAGGCLGCRARLYLVSADGKHLREIPTGPGAVSSPSWSPDGREIIFAREQSEDQRIYSVELRSGRVAWSTASPKVLITPTSPLRGRPMGARSPLPVKSTMSARTSGWFRQPGERRGPSPGPASSGSPIRGGHRTAGRSSSCRPCRRTSPGISTFSACGRGR